MYIYHGDNPDWNLSISANMGNTGPPRSSIPSSLRSKNAGSPGKGWLDSRFPPQSPKIRRSTWSVRGPLATKREGTECELFWQFFNHFGGMNLKLHARLVIATYSIIMITCDRSFTTCKVPILMCDITWVKSYNNYLACWQIKWHDNMIMMHVDIFFLVDIYRGRNLSSILKNHYSIENYNCICSKMQIIYKNVLFNPYQSQYN